jgi:glycosyltransferase involved in cell wall biosynthesis
MKPLVSVGMPVYNGEQYLTQALESVMAQEYENFEVIVSDNASTDRTPEICNEYVKRDSRLRYYRNEKNIGAAGNFTRAFELSQGKYFMWAAHDDLWQPSYVSACVEVLERRPEAAVCCTRLRTINEEGEVVGQIDNNFETCARDPATRIKQLLLHPAPWFAICGLVRSEVLRKCRPFQKVWGSDVVILTEICLVGQVAMVPETLFSYRVYRKKNFRESMLTIDPSSKEKSELPLWKDLSTAILRTIRVSEIGWPVKVRVLTVAIYALSKRWRFWIKEGFERRYRPRYVEPAQVSFEHGNRRAAAGNLILAMLHNPFYLFSYSMWLLLLRMIFGRDNYAAVRRVFRRLFPRRV